MTAAVTAARSVGAFDGQSPTVSTILPNASPDASRSNADRASRERERRVDQRADVRRARTTTRARRARRGSPSSSRRRTAAGRRPGSAAPAGSSPDVAPHTTIRPPGLQRLERVVPGRLADGLHDGVDPLGQPRARLERVVRARAPAPAPAWPRRGWWRSTRSPPARASTIAAVATPPPAPCTSTVSPACSPPRVNSIRYAVSHAVGRQAASAKDSSAGFGTRLRRGTATCSASVPVVHLGQQRAPRVERLVAAAGTGSPITACTTTSLPVLVDARRVAAEDHRQPVRRDADALAATTGRGG